MNRHDVVEREDLVTFLAAATTETRQDEFYTTVSPVPLDFLHEYVRGNYRALYSLSLAVGINDLNSGLVIENLLQHADDTTAATRRVEGKLIAARLRRMPPPRVWKLLVRLCRAGRGNRRLRAVAQQWLDTRDVAFDAIKYRRSMRLVVRHLHLEVPGEVADVLSGRWRRAHQFGPTQHRGAHQSGRTHRSTPVRESARVRTAQPDLLEAWRRAHYEKRALFELPFTVAEGLAASRGIDRATLLQHANLTAQERLRLTTSAGLRGVKIGPDLATVPLTRLVAYVLSLDPAEREDRRAELTAALRSSASRGAGQHAGTWGRVGAVLDDSYSSSGSGTKLRRPLIVAVAVSFALEALASETGIRWTSGRTDPLLATPRGSTDLATPILSSLADQPDTLVIVSDGVDTSPPGAAGEVLRVWSGFIDDGTTTVLHLNPVFDPDRYGVHTLAPAVPTLGIRDAADLPLLYDLAAVASGRFSHSNVSRWLESRAERFLDDAAPHTTEVS